MPKQSMSNDDIPDAMLEGMDPAARAAIKKMQSAGPGGKVMRAVNHALRAEDDEDTDDKSSLRGQRLVTKDAAGQRTVDIDEVYKKFNTPRRVND